ncbi:MAG TPA: hypothetical protein VGR15_00250 [Bacteroidota bacterium]|nr:hypothetical protein [Bacteroidota bacterium]
MKFALFVVTLISGCMTSSPQVVPVLVEGGNRELLVGEWAGEYSSSSNQRSGSITFKLDQGKDTAFGDVLMIARGSNQRYFPEDYSQIPRTDPFASRVLAIKFVHVAGDSVHGLLDPYWDPDRKSTVVTTFKGKVLTNRITGTFNGYDVSTGYTFSGRWQVTRKNP